MKYFNNTATLDEAKLLYRKLAKRLHPDMGGSSSNFQHMQAEYKYLLILLQNKELVSQQPENGNEVIKELSKLIKVLIRKQVPQTLIKQMALNSNSTLERNIYSEIIDLFDTV